MNPLTERIKYLGENYISKMFSNPNLLIPIMSRMHDIMENPQKIKSFAPPFILSFHSESIKDSHLIFSLEIPTSCYYSQECDLFVSQVSFWEGEQMKEHNNPNLLFKTLFQSSKKQE